MRQSVDIHSEAFRKFMGNLDYFALRPEAKLAMLDKFTAAQDRAVADAAHAEAVEREVALHHGGNLDHATAVEKARIADAQGAREYKPAVVHDALPDAAQAYIAKLPMGERRASAVYAYRESLQLKSVIAQSNGFESQKAARRLDELRSRYGTLIEDRVK